MLNEKILTEDITAIVEKANKYKTLGIITSRDLELIVAGLNLIKKDFEAGIDLSKPEDTDAHMLIDRVLTERIGEAGAKLHSNSLYCS